MLSKSCMGGGERRSQAGVECFVQGHPLATLPLPPSLSRASWVLGSTQGLPLPKRPWGAGRQSADWRLQPASGSAAERQAAPTGCLNGDHRGLGVPVLLQRREAAGSSLHRSGSWRHRRVETPSSVGISGSPCAFAPTSFPHPTHP